MLCYILAQYAPQVHENILLFFRHKKQSHRNCCRILNINLVIGICSSNFSKLQMLPTPARHLQIQFQQIADASDPDQASANPIPASCRCFQPRPGICKSNSSKLQMLPTPTRHLQIQFQQIADDSNPDQASANPIPASCRCFQPQDMYLQIHIQQIADASNPDQASANPIPANCRCFQPRPGICKSNSSKLQMLPRPEFTPICICKSNSSKLQMIPTPARHLQIQFQQVADASNPGQASAAPISASCRCFQPQPGICSSQNNKSKMPTGEFSSQIRWWASLLHLYFIK